MKNASFVALIIIALIAGVYFDYQGSNYALTFKHIDIPTGNNSTISKEIVSVPAMSQIMVLFSNFFYALSISLFITMFIVTKIEKSQKEKHEINYQP